mgnify:CR=1 FL=1
MAQTGPLQDKLVVLFGGSGFIGIHVAQALLDRGARLRIASRHPEDAWRLKPLANLGQIQFARCDVLREDSVRACAAGADAVVNLVGSFDGNLKKLMGDAAGRIARAARDAGASALVQVSAIGADAESESGYAAAKARGELLVQEAFPEATIVRPSLVFGEEDGLIALFAGLIRSFPVLPVFAPEAKLQPVYVDDVAEAIATAAADAAAHGGRTYELGGPETLTVMELNRRIAEAQRRKRSFVPMPDFASAAFAMLPGTPMGSDQWLMLKQGNRPSGEHPGFKPFGIEPKPLGLFLDRWMERYRKHGRFAGRVAA